MAQLTLPPDYFRTAAEQYQASPSNRKLWLQDQISKADSSLLQYQAELNAIGAQLIEIGAMKGSSGGVAVVGGVLAAVPTPYTQVIGGVLVIASTFFAKAENKQKSKLIENLQAVGVKRYEEAVLVGQYKSRYETELFFLRIIPLVLTAILILLIIK